MAEIETARAVRARTVRLDRLALPRDARTTGTLAKLMEEDAVVGVTSNPSIFQKALAEGEAYDEQLKELLGEHDPNESSSQLAARRHRAACDLLRPVFERTAARTASSRWRSTRRSPTTREATLERGAAPPRVDRPAEPLREDPGDEAGAPAIEECIAQGKSINITLIFSLERYAEVLEAYLRGLERLVDERRRPVEGALGRELLRLARRHRGRQAARGDRRHAALQGKLAIANAKLAYEHYQRGVLAASAGRRSPAQGATPQRCLWASTSTKNPDYRDVLYVEELIGPETVNTMPRGDDRARSRITARCAATRSTRGRRRGARSVFDELARGRRRLRRRRPRRSRARACRSSPTRSPSCIDGIAREARRARASA